MDDAFPLRNRDTDPDLAHRLVEDYKPSAAEALLVDAHRRNMEAILNYGINAPKLFGSKSFSILAGTRPDDVRVPWESLFMDDNLGSWDVTFTTDRFFDRKFRGFMGVDLIPNDGMSSMLSSHPILQLFKATVLSNNENITINAVGETIPKSNTHFVFPLKVKGREIGTEEDVSIEFFYGSPDKVNLVLSSIQISFRDKVQHFNFEYSQRPLTGITDSFYEESLRNTVEGTKDHDFLRKLIVSSQLVLELSTITENLFDKNGVLLESAQDHLSHDHENTGSKEWIREHYGYTGEVITRSYIGVVDAADLQYWSSQKSVISRLGIPNDFAGVRVWNKDTDSLARTHTTKEFPTLAELVDQVKYSGHKFVLRVLQTKNAAGTLVTAAVAADELFFGEQTLEAVRLTRGDFMRKLVALPEHGPRQDIELRFGKDPDFTFSS